MCGIVGYIGKSKATPILINGLKSLEYRGYDSAGIALLNNKNIEVFKEKGRVRALEETINDSEATIGIAHTRWATHGCPSKENAHPHLDNSKRFAVVHNGIIENFLEIKEFLKDKGYTFLSETDTEVIPNLIDYYYKKEKNCLKAFKMALKELKGSYAILVLSPLLDGILVAKNHSPLVIGKGTQENFIASDIPAILEYTKDFFFLEDSQMAYIKNDSIKFYDYELNEISLESKRTDWDQSRALKDGFDDFMLKEIFEQPRAIRETIEGIITKKEPVHFLNFELSQEYLETLNKIYIVACGTAMHAGFVGKTAIESLTGITTVVQAASEFRYQNPLVDDKTLCIFISQSGETADTIAALNLAKEMGAITIAISNVVASSITRVANYTIYTHAGPEIAVASTKAYVSQVALLVSFALYISEALKKDEMKINSLKEELLALPKKVEEILAHHEEYQKIAKEIYNLEDVFYIGRGNDYNTALEGSLKLKEISYIHSEAYPAGELKHGPIALIEDGSIVMGIITRSDIAEKTLSNLMEVEARGANTILVTNVSDLKSSSKTILIPITSELISPILSIIPLQLLAYYIAKEKNLDVDKPRNLAKSVTVE